MSDELPTWARDRLDEDDQMGTFEGTPGQRVAYTVSVLIALGWHALVWVVFLGIIAGALYGLGKLMS